MKGVGVCIEGGARYAMCSHHVMISLTFRIDSIAIADAAFESSAPASFFTASSFFLKRPALKTGVMVSTLLEGL